MTRLLLWDMDGTLADDSHRKQYYLDGDYEKYFSYEAQMADTPYQEAYDLYFKMRAEFWTMGYLTARLERNRPATEDWLLRHGFDGPGTAMLRPEELAHMRPPEFKSMRIGELLASYEKVILVDNDPDVVARITIDHGSDHVIFAHWDKNPDISSITNKP